MVKLFKNAEDYSSLYEKLHSTLFGEQADGIRLIWEYTNIMYLDFDNEEFLGHYKAELDGFKGLTELYKKFSTLPITEEKTIISLFRFYLGLDNYNEECNVVEIQRKTAGQEQKEE